jgi:hypothetical protein
MTKPEVTIEEFIEALEYEFERLRNDAAERAQAAGRGAALVGTAGGLALVSAVALGSLPLLALRRILPPWAIALGVAGGSAAGAAVLGRMGAARLAAISPQALEQEVGAAAEEVADAVK